MKKRRYLSKLFRSPRTQQEIKANKEKFEEKISGRKRKLPTAWDDQFIKHQKCWKYLRREKQYRIEENYSWHLFEYNWHELHAAKNLTNKLKSLGCFHEYICGGIRWYGPDIKGYS